VGFYRILLLVIFVQEIFLTLIQHPLLRVFLATGGVYWLLTQVTPRDLKTCLSMPISALDVRAGGKITTLSL
jgi:hypothetical protein